MTINRTTFLNALLALHTVGDLKELPEDLLNSLVDSMQMTSDEAVMMVNLAQKDGLVHLRWRGWVTLTDAGRDAAEGRGTATYAGAAPFLDTGANGVAVRLDAAAGELFGAAQFLSGDSIDYMSVDKAKSAAAVLAISITKAEPDRNAVVADLDALRDALAALPEPGRSAAAANAARHAAGTIANWAGVAWR